MKRNVRVADCTYKRMIDRAWSDLVEQEVYANDRRSKGGLGRFSRDSEFIWGASNNNLSVS